LYKGKVVLGHIKQNWLYPRFQIRNAIRIN
jgi:hypothetical protein